LSNSEWVGTCSLPNHFGTPKYVIGTRDTFSTCPFQYKAMTSSVPGALQYPTKCNVK